MNENNEMGMSTPKVMRSSAMATSTVDRTKSQKRRDFTNSGSQLESSLGILSLNNVDLSNIIDVSTVTGSIDQVLKQQRQLANNTLNRASRVSAIPSKLLLPNVVETKSETNINLQSESTVSESDLLQTPKNTSTPRNSSSEMDLMRLANPTPRESIFSRFRDMLDTDISTHNAVEEFKQIAQANKNMSDNATLDSGLFLPAEEAASKLMADELSWKRKHDLPVAQNLTSFQETKDLPSMSIGEFFQQGSNNISEFRVESPTKAEPVALIDSSSIVSNASNISNMQDESSCQSSRSLSISAIQQVLAEAEDTPRKVMDYLFKQNIRTSAQKSSTQRESSQLFSVPVSRDTSYTTSFSDNEAVKAAVNENKENVQPFIGNRNAVNVIVAQPLPQTDSSPSTPKSLSPPSRSSSCLTSLPNGKLPIESTVGELVWGCVKVDRCVTKQFMLRNKTPKTLRLQCSVSTYEFKIRKDNRSDSDHLSACKFVLHGHESRPLIISFIPTKIGPAVDELVFAPLDTNLTQTKKQCVRLWGYGGYSNIEYQNASRDNTGKYWLSLGRMDNRILMEQIFTIKNVGNLPSFTYIKVVPKNIVTFTNLKIEPNLFVLLPNEEKSVKVSYTPNAKDCRILKQNLNVLPVSAIGKLEIVSGCEVSRARLRRLCRKSVEKGLKVDDLTKILSEKISGEVFPSNIAKFKEYPNAIPEILETLNIEEMAVTIEQDPNQTMVAEYPEDSIVYQSLCQTTVVLDESVVHHKSCRLEPPSVVLFPPSKPEDSIFLISESTKILHYEITSSPKGLYLSPTDGAISPGETVEFKIKLVKNSSDTCFKILVYVENEVFESEVKVLNVRSSRKHFLE